MSIIFQTIPEPDEEEEDEDLELERDVIFGLKGLRNRRPPPEPASPVKVPPVPGPVEPPLEDNDMGHQNVFSTEKSRSPGASRGDAQPSKKPGPVEPPLEELQDISSGIDCVDPVSSAATSLPAILLNTAPVDTVVTSAPTTDSAMIFKPGFYTELTDIDLTSSRLSSSNNSPRARLPGLLDSPILAPRSPNYSPRARFSGFLDSPLASKSENSPGSRLGYLDSPVVAGAHMSPENMSDDSLAPPRKKLATMWCPVPETTSARSTLA